MALRKWLKMAKKLKNKKNLKKEKHKKMVKKIMSMMMVMAMCAGCLIACSGDSSSNDSSDSGNLTAVIALGEYDPQISGQQIIALEQGYFEEEGLDVDLQLLTDPSVSTTMIASNEAQFYSVSNYQAINLVDKGTDVCLLAPTVNAGNTQVVVAGADSGIVNAKDMEGKRMGYTDGAGVIVAVQNMCDDLGVDFDSIELVNLQASDMLASLESGDIDSLAAYMLESGLNTSEVTFDQYADTDILEAIDSSLVSYAFSKRTEEEKMAVVIDHLYKAYEEKNGEMQYVLNDLNLRMEKGEFICVLGKSGCGKSTLLNCLAGYLKPDKGSIEVDGNPISGPGPERGVVFQQHALFPWRTVLKNVQFGLEINGAKKARALANDPEVLLMDEPLGALDALTRDSMRREIERIWKLTEKTILFITHSVPEAVFLADRVIILNKGKVQLDQKVDLPRSRNINDPKFSAYVQQFESTITGVSSDGVITE